MLSCLLAGGRWLQKVHGVWCRRVWPRWVGIGKLNTGWRDTCRVHRLVSNSDQGKLMWLMQRPICVLAFCNLLMMPAAVCIACCVSFMPQSHRQTPSQASCVIICWWCPAGVHMYAALHVCCRATARPQARLPVSPQQAWPCEMLRPSMLPVG